MAVAKDQCLGQYTYHYNTWSAELLTPLPTVDIMCDSTPKIR
jgi:hypothetical protein